MKRVIIYYSYTGNTKRIVERIQKELVCETIEIIPVIPYSENYQSVVDEMERKVPQNDQPEIKPLEQNLDSYDEIILATPVWWYTVSSPINTFLHQYDLTNKVVIPIMTNGGWIGHTLKDIETLSKGTMIDPLNLEYEENRLKNEEPLVVWLERRKKQ